MKLILWFTVPALLMASVPAEQKGKQIVEEAVAALGGEKFLSMQDRVATGWTGAWSGNVSRNIRTKFYTSYAGEAVSERQAFDKNETYSWLFNPEGAWEITYRGARPIEKDREEIFRRDAHFNILNILRTRLQEPGLTFAYRGSEVCEKQMGDVVEVISQANEPVVRVCFDRNTRLPIRQSYFRLNSFTKERLEEVTTFARYQDADGVLWPRQISWYCEGEPVQQVFLEDVEVNRGVPPAQFTLAPDVKRLKPVAGTPLGPRA